MPSLQDQLLKAGMIDAKKAKLTEKEKRKNDKKIRKGQAEADTTAKEAAEKARQVKLAKDREANLKAKKIADEKAIAAQIIQLIESNKIDRSGSSQEIGYQFVDDKKIKKLYVNAEQQRQLERGVIAIVRLQGNYELVSAPVAEKIRQRDEHTVLVLNDRSAAGSNEPEEDDPYADYKIPDDLMW